MVKIRIGDREVEGVELDFEVGREEWNEYKLLDGGLVRVKIVVTRIFQVVDSEGAPLLNPDGTPQIVINSSNIVVPRS